MFKEGQILDFRLVKELELGNAKKKLMFMASNGKKLLVPAEHYASYNFRIGQTVSCKVDRINCSGQVFLEPLNPEYKEGEIYAFQYYGYEKVRTFLGDERYFAKVKDKYNRIIRILTTHVPDCAIGEEISCKVEMIKKGALSLSLEQDPTLLQTGQVYVFEYVRDEELPNYGMCGILHDPFGGKHLFQKHLYEHYQLQVGEPLRARVERYNRMGEYKIEPENPLYKLDEVYYFRFMKLYKTEDEETETQAVILVEDAHGREQTITQFTSCFLARYPAERLPARVDRIINATMYLHAVEE